MKTGITITTALAVLLGASAGGAIAQTLPSPVTPLDASAPLTDRDHAARPDDVAQPRRPLTVMGMTGGIEPKHPESTGSIVRHPAASRQGR